ncbi:hypothetical protein LCGC14_0965740 [marine sediment metagenome]|uniref:Uncharacterized protein n=1 Tax=marine sediment metagenome TaxID=412755 RepID=A0A0F9ND93_9ZZZZ
MSPQPSGSWKTGSGLLDDFRFTIEEAWFSTHEKYGDAVLLFLRGFAEQQDDDGNLVVVDDEQTLQYSTGDGWEITSGGREVTHAAGKTTFVNNTNMGRLIDAVVGLGDEVIEELGSRGETYEADTWENLIFHVERKSFSYKDRDTEEKVSYEVPLPIDFLGVHEPEEEEKPKAKPKGKGRGTSAKGGAKGKGRGKAKAEEESESESEPEEESKPKGRGRKKKTPTLEEAVMEFAADFEDHAAFLEDVFDGEKFGRADELSDDEELSANVLDEDGSVWVDSGPDSDK